MEDLSVAHMTAAMHSNTARPRKYIYSSALEFADVICEHWAHNFFSFSLFYFPILPNLFQVGRLFWDLPSQLHVQGPSLNNSSRKYILG